MSILTAMFRRGQTSDESADFARRVSELTEQLRDVRSNFDFADDSYAIDALIYEENALLCRIEQLHSEAKARGITVQPFVRF